jgi:A/G-specific adenine glycosylase
MSHFSHQIINWYHIHHRNLPWRSTTDPYKIWLSEVILQQTRVAQGMEYYNKFIARYPNIKKLAAAPEEEVLKLWQGLGYYSRARNLHFAAQQVVTQFNGCFPSTFGEILKLKGIGKYTAAAIASFAFNEKQAVVDGNVYRVLARVYGIDAPIDDSQAQKYFQELADSLISDKNPALHNQAIMEFGALQCTPKSPDCMSCPLNESCIALRNGIVDLLPVKAKKTKVKIRYLNYFFLTNGNKFYLKKRTENDIWKNMYDFPLIEQGSLLNTEDLLKNKAFTIITGIKKGKLKVTISDRKHLLTHRTIQARFFKMELKNELVNHGFILCTKKDLKKMALPRLIESYLEEEGF